MSGPARRGALAVCVAWLLGAATAGASPPCATQCQALFDTGQLQPDVSVQSCAERVCQEAARTLYRDNKFEEALEALDWIQPTRGEEPSYQLDRGLVLYALGRFEEAIGCFDVVLRSFPSSIRAGAQRAHSLEKLGRLDEARKQFEALLDRPGVEREFRGLLTRSYLLSSIALLRLRDGEVKEGKRQMQEALELDAGNNLATTFLERVIPSLENGDLAPEGLGLLQSAFEHMTLGRQAVAAREFEEVIQRWPRYAPAYMLLAEGLRVERRYAACEDLLLAAEKHHPEDIDLRLHRIRCNLLRHGVASAAAKPAIDQLKEIAEAHPDNRLARQILAAVDSPF